MWVSHMAHSQDSAGSSVYQSSYAPESQCSDFSQINTQDLFSQNSSGTQNEQTQPKKLSMYEKWLSKRSLYKRDSTTTDSKLQICKDGKGPTDNVNVHVSANKPYCITESRPSLHPVSLAFGQERDLLEQIKSSFQDSSKEIRSALDGFKTKLDTTSELSQEQLCQTFSTFLRDIWKHQEEMYNVLSEHCKNKSSSEELQKQIAVNESKICLLEEQLLTVRQSESEKLSKNMQDVVSSQLLKSEQKLEEILKWIKQTNEKQELQLDDYKNCVEKYLQEIMNQYSNRIFNSKGFKEIEKTIISEMTNFKEKMEERFGDIQFQLMEEFQVLLKKQGKDISDTNKQLLKQFNQNIAPLKNLTSQNNTIIMEQFQVLGVKLGTMVKNCFTQGNEWSITSMQNSLTESLRPIVSILLKQSHDGCTANMLQKVENRLQCHLSPVPRCADEFSKVDYAQAMTLNEPPQKRASDTSRALHSTNVDVQPYTMSLRSKRYLTRSFKSTNDTGVENNVYNEANNPKDGDKVVYDMKTTNFPVNNYYGNVKSNSICLHNKANSNNSFIKQKSNSRKRPYCDSTNKQNNEKHFQEDTIPPHKCKPASFLSYEEETNASQTCNYQVEKEKFKNMKKPFQSNLETVENLHQTIETRSEKKFWSKKFEKNMQKSIQSSQDLHECYADMANKLQFLSSRKIEAIGRSSLDRTKGQRKNEIETNSCDSSPTVSITKVTIKKIKAPYIHTRFVQDTSTLTSEQMNRMAASPTHTILSDI